MTHHGHMDSRQSRASCAPSGIGRSGAAQPLGIQAQSPAGTSHFALTWPA